MCKPFGLGRRASEHCDQNTRKRVSAKAEPASEQKSASFATCKQFYNQYCAVVVAVSYAVLREGSIMR